MATQGKINLLGSSLNEQRSNPPLEFMGRPITAFEQRFWTTYPAPTAEAIAYIYAYIARLYANKDDLNEQLTMFSEIEDAIRVAHGLKLWDIASE